MPLTSEQRQRLHAIRARKNLDGTTSFLLSIIAELEAAVAQAQATALAHRELGDAFEKAAFREEAELKARIAELETALADLGKSA